MKTVFHTAGRTALRAAVLLVCLWLCFTLLLTLTAMIPCSAVEEHIREASEAYQLVDLFERLFDREELLLHHYADVMLLDIIWNQDSTQPLAAALDAVYYDEEGTLLNRDLEATIAGAAPNASYARYWHGMLIFLKPLLCVMGMDGVKIVGAVALAALVALYVVLLLRRGQRAAAIASAVGLVLCHVWVTPLCIEYYACFALAFGFADYVLWRGERLRQETLMFVCIGALTCFFDFLTCEILTLGIPLVCLLLLRREESAKQLWALVCRCCAAWLIAYALTWCCKWGLSAVVLRRGLNEIALAQGLHRVKGRIPIAVGTAPQPLAAIRENLERLFPFVLLPDQVPVWWLLGAIAAAVWGVWYFYRRERRLCPAATLLMLLALLPFVRYLLINNHSMLHGFFTYRDLFLTILAGSCAVAMSVSFRDSWRKRKVNPGKQRKKKKGRR